MVTPLSISKNVFTTITAAARTPIEFQLSIASNNGSLAHFVDYGLDGSSKPDMLRKYSGLSCVWLLTSIDLLIQTPFGPRHDFSAAISIDLASGRSFLLLFVKREVSMNAVMARIKLRAGTKCRSPLDILLFLFEDYGRYNEIYRAKLDEQVVWLEQNHKGTSLVVPSSEQKRDPLNHEELTIELHKCNSNLIFLANLLSFEKELGAFCSNAFFVLEKLRGQRGETALHTDRNKSYFQDRLAFFINDTELRQRQTASLQARVQSQINLVSGTQSFLYPSTTKPCTLGAISNFK
jgi:hypothetical protein